MHPQLLRPVPEKQAPKHLAWKTNRSTGLWPSEKWLLKGSCAGTQPLWCGSVWSRGCPDSEWERLICLYWSISLRALHLIWHTFRGLLGALLGWSLAGTPFLRSPCALFHWVEVRFFFFFNSSFFVCVFFFWMFVCFFLFLLGCCL